MKEIDYERANNLKTNTPGRYSLKRVQNLATKEYKAFVERNNHWLMPYAAFCVLRDKFGTPDFTKWGVAAFSPKVLKDNQGQRKRN